MFHLLPSKKVFKHAIRLKVNDAVTSENKFSPKIFFLVMQLPLLHTLGFYALTRFLLALASSYYSSLVIPKI